MTQELLPCPFCGGEAKLHFGLAGFDDAQIDCQSCASSGPNFDESPYQGEGARNYNAAEAIIAWNTRAASPTGNWQETLNELQRLEEENAAKDARILELEGKLIEERVDVLWNAYHTGHEKDGRWSHMFMSDGEWLVREMGLDQTLGDYDAEAIKARIPEIARAALEPSR